MSPRPLTKPPTHCACGCRKRLPPYRGTGKYQRFLNEQHRMRVWYQRRAAKVPDDLTDAQITAIITQTKARLRYERTRQS